ncbi:hypothetical protein BaRGS_00001213 [Batillaria attramentaria]|uniref:Uncharacterized protein n=1 Tax=Batillaria attramentaria TaxID=370345 RepID=A0ABD0M696_9CAEN
MQLMLLRQWSCVWYYRLEGQSRRLLAHVSLSQSREERCTRDWPPVCVCTSAENSIACTCHLNGVGTILTFVTFSAAFDTVCKINTFQRLKRQCPIEMVIGPLSNTIQLMYANAWASGQSGPTAATAET